MILVVSRSEDDFGSAAQQLKKSVLEFAVGY
jgi:hypothetical protein